jgi:hypothetical protein
MYNFHFRLRRMGDYYVLFNGKSLFGGGLRGGQQNSHLPQSLLKEGGRFAFSFLSCPNPQIFGKEKDPPFDEPFSINSLTTSAS